MPKPIVDAATIMDAIAKGTPVAVDSARVNGSLDLSHGRYPACISITNSDIERLAFTHSTFEGRICLDGSSVAGETSLQGSTFNAELSLDRCTFGGPTDASNVSAQRGLTATDCKFGGNFDAKNLRAGLYTRFDRSAFNGRIEFDASKVDGYLSLSACTLEGTASFKSSTVTDDLFFTEANLNGKTGFQEAHVGRNFDLSRSRLYDLSMKGATIGGDLDGHGCVFSREAKCQRLRVDGQAVFSSTTFEQRANFESSRFGGDVKFTDAVFKGKACFGGIDAAGDLSFDSATFEAESDFQGAQTDGDMVFDKTRCIGPALFIGAATKGQAQFVDVKFDATVSFDMLIAGQGFYGSGIVAAGEFSFVLAAIGNDLDVDNARFGANAAFNRTTVKSNLFARNVGFAASAYFVSVSVGAEAKFEGCQFTTDGSTWDLQWTSFNILRIDPELADDQPLGPDRRRAPYRLDRVVVLLGGCVYNRLYAYWKRFLRPGSTSVDLQPYTQLETVLKRQGLDDAAARVYYEGHRMVGNAIRTRWGSPGFARRSFVDLPADRLLRFVGYGVNSKNLLLLAVILTVAGFLVFAQPGSTCSVTSGGACVVSDTAQSWDQAAWLSVRTFLPVDIPALPQKKASDQAIRPFGVRMRADYYASALRLMGWIIIPTLIAALAGLLRRGPTA